MNMIIPFIALFLSLVALRETKSISNIAHVLSGVSNVIDLTAKKKKKQRIRSNRFVFYIRWGATMRLIII